MSTLLSLRDIHKRYVMGGGEVHALRGVSLEIEEGDFVAIMGPSGSGKSTLMHLLGLLDVPSSGSYRIAGQEASGLGEDELAILRRGMVGFIFQQFNLLPRMSATQNVSLPLIYSTRRPDARRAVELLSRVGLEDRKEHRPNELSGGQQQRVAIARSLVNRPRVLLADEPTGNLDSVSEREILEVLQDLNRQGITVIVVTHEEDIGAQACRRVRIRDGVIQSDERLRPQPEGRFPATSPSPVEPGGGSLNELREHARQGLQTLAANKVRTGLSMLGILIGVAAVVAMLAIGRGAQKSIETQLQSLGSNLIVLRPGSLRVGGVAQGAGGTSRLTLGDAAAIQQDVVGVRHAAPTVSSGNLQITYADENWNTQVLGASPEYAEMHAASPEYGRFFTADENQRRARVAVLGATVVRELFGGANPIGKTVKINRVIFQVIGLLPEKGASGFRDQDDVAVIPINTAMYRVMGKKYADYIDIESQNALDMDAVQAQTLKLMMSRHHVPLASGDDAFQIRNLADIQAALTESNRTMSLLLASIAAISLLVGGIGIMNIMLVSVTERTREIGLRKAVGARRRDILMQFLVESVAVSAVGGSFGILLGWAMTAALTAVAGWATSVSAGSVVLAFGFSAGVGMVFGIYPARQASLLSPIDALRHE